MFLQDGLDIIWIDHDKVAATIIENGETLLIHSDAVQRLTEAEYDALVDFAGFRQEISEKESE